MAKRRVRRRAVFAWMAVSGIALLLSSKRSAHTAADGPSRTAIADRIHELSERVVTNPFDGLTAVGPDRLANLDLLTWLREGLARMETLTGLPVPDGTDFRVVVPDAPATGQPAATIEQRTGGSRPILIVTLRDYEQAATRTGYQALVQAVLTLYLTAPDMRQPHDDIPDWLITGFVRNLSPDWRAADMDRVLNAWQRGRLGPIESLVRGEPAMIEPAETGAADLTAAWQGAFVNWLISTAGRPERFAAVFRRLANGDAVTPEWLLPHVWNPSGADFDDAWDRWLLRQRHRVYQVGGLPARLPRQLRAELLLSPGSYGIPLDVPFGPGTPLEAITGHRDAPWVPGFARQAIVRLERLGAGRAEPFRDVIKAWCDVFNGVLDGTPEAVLQDRIRHARELLSALEQAVPETDGE